MAVKKFLKTRDGKQIWPITATEAVYDREQGKLLSEVLKDQNNNINAEKERAEGVEAELQGAIDVINGEGEGSIKKAQADAQAHAEQKIAELVDSAPEALDTLNELAQAINDNKDIYDAYVEQHNQAMNDMRDELQGQLDVLKEIDHDSFVIKEEGKSLLADEEAAKIHEHANKELLDSLTQDILDQAGAIILADSLDTNEYPDIVEEQPEEPQAQE